jgi:GNAT superfamily N-acetyltransferase
MKYLEAKIEDLSDIINLLQDDILGKTRESVAKDDFSSYKKAFLAIDKDPNNRLIVVKEKDKVVATMQLTIIPYLTFSGGRRLQIEAVRVHSSHRAKGLGQTMITWAVSFAKKESCHLVQLTSNKERKEAISFYEKCGFKASHEGFKLYLK